MAEKIFNAVLPPVPRESDRQVMQFNAAIKQALEELRNNVVLSKDGIVSKRNSNASRDDVGSGASPLPATTAGTPSAPVNLQASGAIENIVLSWDYSGNEIEYFEIWRADSNSFGLATLRAITQGTVYSDTIGAGNSKYYWVRGVADGEVFGPFNAVSGVLGQTALDPVDVLTDVTGGIRESDLAQSLLNDFSSLAGVSDQYTLKLDVNGKIAGFGLWNDGNTSDFQIVSDRFAIVNQNNNGDIITPFVVSNGNVVMDNAYIVNLTASNIAAGSITADQIQAGTITADEIEAGTITADELDANSVTSDKIAANNVTAGKIVLDNATIVGDGNAIKIANLGVNTLQIANNAVTVPEITFNLGKISSSVAASTAYTVLQKTITPTAIGSGYAPILIGFSMHVHVDQKEGFIAAVVKDTDYSNPLYIVGRDLTGTFGAGNSVSNELLPNTVVSGVVSYTPTASTSFTVNLILYHNNAKTLSASGRVIYNMTVKK